MRTYDFGKCEICGKELDSHNGMVWREKGNNKIRYFGMSGLDDGFHSTCRKKDCKKAILQKMKDEGKLWELYVKMYPELIN